jgi:NAD-dependent SIR2 family protein deacetylase
MVKEVQVTRFAAEDGSIHRTAGAAQLHDWRANPDVRVEPAAVKYDGITYDLHGTLWRWTCGRCKKPAGERIDTMLRYYSAGCTHCLATNVFDFHKYDGVDEQQQARAACA